MKRFLLSQSLHRRTSMEAVWKFACKTGSMQPLLSVKYCSLSICLKCSWCSLHLWQCSIVNVPCSYCQSALHLMSISSYLTYYSPCSFLFPQPQFVEFYLHHFVQAVMIIQKKKKCQEDRVRRIMYLLSNSNISDRIEHLNRLAQKIGLKDKPM